MCLVLEGASPSEKALAIDNRQDRAMLWAMSSRRLLIIWHSRTGASEALARAVAIGAGDTGILLPCEQVAASDLADADGYVFCCPENLATMSGAMKEMFDRCYYQVLGKIEGRPYASIIAAGSDGQGAQAQLDRIARGWRLRRVAEPIIVNTAAQTPEQILTRKSLPSNRIEEANALGQAMAEGLAQGIF